MNKEIRINEFDYANEEGFTSEEEAAGSFCGSVLLSEDEWDKDKLISDL